MSTEPMDIYEYRAALLEWHQDHIGQTQRIGCIFSQLVEEHNQLFGFY